MECLRANGIQEQTHYYNNSAITINVWTLKLVLKHDGM